MTAKTDIKPGDLVMVVKLTPCCGNTGSLGTLFTVKDIVRGPSICKYCSDFRANDVIAVLPDENGCDPRRLKKIDPPAEGDDFPAVRDVEVMA